MTLVFFPFYQKNRSHTMLLTLSRRAYNYPLALLALCVFSHGTLLAPQVYPHQQQQQCDDRPTDERKQDQPTNENDQQQQQQQPGNERSRYGVLEFPWRVAIGNPIQEVQPSVNQIEWNYTLE